MKTCENCGNEHDGTYGSGRFCSVKCSRGFSTKSKRNDINKKVSNKLKKNNIITKQCKQCNNEFSIAYNKRHQDVCSRKCSSKLGWTNHNKVDWSSIHKKAYANGNNYVTGGTTPWVKYKDIKVQGSYELRMCEILDEQKSNLEILDWEYSTTRIKYEYEGKNRTYLIDFTIINLDGTKKCIEVKGRETELDYIKWKAANEQGIQLEIWRKKDLFK